MKVNIGKINELLKNREMTRADLARATGIEYYSLASVWKRAACGPETAVKIADALDVLVEEIMPAPTAIDDAREFLKDRGEELAVFAYQAIDDSELDALAETVLFAEMVAQLGIDTVTKRMIAKRADMLVDAVYLAGHDAGNAYGHEAEHDRDRIKLREAVKLAIEKKLRNI